MTHRMASLFGRKAFRVAACFATVGTGMGFSGVADAKFHSRFNRSNDFLLKGRKENAAKHDHKDHPMSKMATSLQQEIRGNKLKYAHVFEAIECMKREHPTYEDGLSRESVTSLFNFMGVKDKSVVDSVFDAMDSDSDGNLAYEDVMSTLMLLTEGRDSEKAKFLFRVIDADKSGLVDADEMRRFIRALLKVKFVVTGAGLDSDVPEFFLDFTDKDYNAYAKYSANKLVCSIFMFADSDRNGELDYKEFKRWFNRGGPDVIAMKAALHDLVETGQSMAV